MVENKISNHPLLEIYLLGRFQVKIDGIPVAEKRWGRRSAKALIKLLALKSFHALHREQIMDLLWAEDSPETSLNNLNKAIYEARRVLEPDLAKGSNSLFIKSQNQQIILELSGSLCVDLDEFEQLANYALQNSDLEAGQKAVKLYRGDLLGEDIYEDWIYIRRESARIQFRKVAAKTAELYAAKGEQAESIEILKKLIAEDATDEYVHRLLMQFYAETGSKYQALNQFKHCRTALLALGIEPEPETIKLEQSIKCGEIPPVKNRYKSAPAKSAAPVASTPRITPLTFQNGVIKSAKFLPDGETVIVSAAWEGGDMELYKMSLKTKEMRRLEIKNVEIFSISPAGDMAVALKPGGWNGFTSTATLAKLSLSGESPLEIFKDVQWADWHPSKNTNSSFPDGQFLAIVCERDGKICLEYPIGNVIFKTGGWISHPRFSADGKYIAFIEHPMFMDDEGFIVILDLKEKKKQVLTKTWRTIYGLGWMKDEIWFTAASEGAMRTINSVNLKGEEHLIYRGTSRFRLHDISNNGKVLVTDDKIRRHTFANHTDDGIERDISWHEHTLPRDLTNDGKMLLIEEAIVSGSNYYSAYIQKIDGSCTKMIGSGSPLAFSPDGKHILLRIPSPHNHLALMEIETGELKELETFSSFSLIYEAFSCFFPDGKRIIFAANEVNRGTRIYIQNIDGGIPVCFTPDEEGVKMHSTRSISPDGSRIVLNNFKGELSVYQTLDGKSSTLKNLNKDFYLVRWSGDGNNLFIRRWGELPTIVYRYNLASETMENWLEIMPEDATGVYRISGIHLTPDGKTYTYSNTRLLSDLYLMEDF